MPKYGPVTPFSQNLHNNKYRLEGESFNDFTERFAITLAEDEKEYNAFKDIIGNQRFLPGGRVQLAVGNPSNVTSYNCFVGGKIEDSMRGELTDNGIMDELLNSAMTLRMGGGCGWDFSTIRPKNNPINGLGGVPASGPVSFMGMWDAMCSTIMSQGLRRGAMMGVLRVDHPDILEFIHAKQDQHTLKNFNISVAVTDEFMTALENNEYYDLKFDGNTEYIDKQGRSAPYGKLLASEVWDLIMKNTWDWAEPGVLFIDHINKMHPLSYCEYIAATNPCGEQPLTYNDGCLLGSFNIVKYLVGEPGNAHIDYEQLILDIIHAVKMMNRVIDTAKIPLDKQRKEILMRRRMGLGVTGIANAIEFLGFPYASKEYIEEQEKILATIRDHAYMESAYQAREKGSFEKFEAEKWLQSGFAQSLPTHVRELIREFGLRNSLLLSIAPTGTISMCADNVSSGIEPPYFLEGKRTIKVMEDGKEIQKEFDLIDWLYKNYGIKSRTADDITAEEHVSVLCSAQKFVDSAVSKTCNVGDHVTFDEFKAIYFRAWKGGAKGCTTFRRAGKRFGIMRPKDEAKSNVLHHENDFRKESKKEYAACYIDPVSGVKTCEG